jgi:hypothetical protein
VQLFAGQIDWFGGQRSQAGSQESEDKGEWFHKIYGAEDELISDAGNKYHQAAPLLTHSAVEPAAATELILRQFFDVASLAQNDVLPAAVSPPKKAQDDGIPI